MPTYDYECANGHSFEHLQPITSDPLGECLQCGASVRRLIGGGSGIIFKGSGFYVTDSKGKSGGSAEATDKSKSEATAKDGSSKSSGDRSKSNGDGSKSSLDTTSKKTEKATST